MIAPERVPAARFVPVMPPVRGQQIVGLIIYTPVAVSRSVQAAFAGVVVNHIQPYFDAAVMEGFDHSAEFFDRALRCCRWRRSPDWGKRS